MNRFTSFRSITIFAKMVKSSPDCLRNDLSRCVLFGKTSSVLLDTSLRLG